MAATTPLIGVWSGDQTVLTLTANGGRIEQGCSSGSLAGPIRPDRKGRFSVGGTRSNHGGSMPQLEVADAAAPVRYSGVVTGKNIKLTMHQPGQADYQVSLAPGRSAKLIRCY